MSPTKKALALFAAGVPVRDIGPLVGMTGEPLRELLTYTAIAERGKLHFQVNDGQHLATLHPAKLLHCLLLEKVLFELEPIETLICQ